MSQTQTIHQSSIIITKYLTSPPSDSSPTPLESTSNFTLILRLTSSILAFFTAGLNDGSLGSLIPYILDTYTLSTSSIAFLYLSCFLGWAFAAISIPFLQTNLRLGIGGILLLGASLQLLTQFIRIWGPPWPLFVVSFGLAALGQAYQDAQANTYIAQVGDKAHRWLGVVHAAYSVGCLLGPLAVTAVATAKPVHWMESYGALAGVAGLNVCLVVWAFARELVIKPLHDQNNEERGEEGEQSDHARRGSAMWRDVVEILGAKSVWVISLFFFFHLGSSITIGGWLVTYLITLAPNSGIKTTSIGYLPTLFYAGNALGRLFLIEPTHRFGEKPMILLYSFLCIILQIISWRLASLIGSVVIVCLLGFFLGPFFPAAITHAKSLLPSRIITPALGLMFVIGQAGGNIFPAVTGILAANLDGGDGGGARDLTVDGNQPDSGIRILIGKGWSDADAMSPENWTLALPFTKTSNYNILSASAFVTPRSFLQIHQNDIPLPFNVDPYVGVSQPRCVAKLFIRHELEQLDVRIKNPAIGIGAIESGTGQHNYRVVTDKIQNSSNRYDENGVSSMDTLHIDFTSTSTSLSKAEHSVAATSVCVKGALLATNC
ncbi:glucose and galactose transporter [Botrytis cinerea]